jgi:hypothetical protein
MKALELFPSVRAKCLIALGKWEGYEMVHQPFSERPISEQPFSERPISERPIPKGDHSPNDHSPKATILRTTNLRTTNPQRRPFSERPFSESDHSPNDQYPKTTNPRKTDYCQAVATMGAIFAMAKNREKNFYTLSQIFSLCCTWFFICNTGDRYLNIWIELCRVNAWFTVLGLGWTQG